MARPASPASLEQYPRQTAADDAPRPGLAARAALSRAVGARRSGTLRALDGRSAFGGSPRPRRGVSRGRSVPSSGFRVSSESRLRVRAFACRGAMLRW